MLLKEIMQTNVKTARPESSIQEAGKIMAENDIGSLVVIDGTGKLVGILTDSDIIKNVVSKGEDVNEIKVGDIMTKDVIVASPDANLEEAADVLVKYKIKHLPVVDQGSVVGMITGTDLIAYEEALIEKIAALLIARRDHDHGEQVGG